MKYKEDDIVIALSVGFLIATIIQGINMFRAGFQTISNVNIFVFESITFFVLLIITSYYFTKHMKKIYP